MRKLLLKSNNIYAIIIETKKQLKKLRVKAETNINYRECTYLEQKDSDVCKLTVPEFTSDMNIITFVNSIKKTMREKLLDIHVLKTILKTKISDRVYGKLSTDVFTRSKYDLNDILKFSSRTMLHQGNLKKILWSFIKKTGTLRFCFKNDDHRNLDMGKSIDISQLIELQGESKKGNPRMLKSMVS